MPRFFCEYLDKENPCITGTDANHIGKSLRMRTGEQITVCEGGTDHLCKITSITPDTVYLQILESHLCAAEPSVSVTLYQAVPKQDKLEQIVQKAVELGVSRVVPVLTRRCISRPDAKDFAKKQKRLQAIAESAAKQSGRGIIPEILPLQSYREALRHIEQERYDNGLFFYEEGGTRFSELSLNAKGKIAIFIGSEGGFDREEADEIQKYMTPVWLGERILRCETAPIVALSILMQQTGNL